MKKKSKIKILKNSNRNSYTFVDDFNNTFLIPLSKSHLNDKKNEEKGKSVKIEEKDSNLNKAPIDKKDILKSSKGLKFSKPSQRNHSSIYE